MQISFKNLKSFDKKTTLNIKKLNISLYINKYIDIFLLIILKNLKIFRKLETKTQLIHILLRESEKDGTNGDDKYV